MSNEEKKGKVEFGCATSDDGKKHRPYICIGFGKITVTFHSDVLLDSQEDAKNFTKDVFSILSGAGDVNVHEDPAESTLEMREGLLDIKQEPKKNSSILSLADTDGFIKEEDC